MLALVLVIGLATTAGAHTGSAGLLHRNHSNPVSAVTSLAGSVPGSVLGITNNNTAATNGSATAITAANNNATSPTVRATNAAGGTALDLTVTCKTTSACFKPAPMSVNSDTKVANLNADELDGSDSSDFLTPNNVRVFSAQFDFGSIPAGACRHDVLTGSEFSSLVGDPTFVSVGYDFHAFSQPVTAQNFVPIGDGSQGWQDVGPGIRFQFCNPHQSALDPPALEFKFVVVHM